MESGCLLIRLFKTPRKNELFFLLFLLMFSSCSSYSPVYWGWGEWISPEFSDIKDPSVTKFDWSGLPGVITLIDGEKAGAGYKKAKLLPGNHRIEYAYYPAEFGIHPKGLIEIELKAGHEYVFRIKLCYSCTPRRYTASVHDRTTHEIVWEKPNVE